MKSDLPLNHNQLGKEAVISDPRATRTQRFFFGDDVFVSYARHDSDYALALADELTKQKLSCFLDQWGTPAGEELPPELVERLKKSTMLVIIGTQWAAGSDNVRKEIVEFKKTKRPIIPITFVEEEDFSKIRNNEMPDSLKGTLEGAAWYSEIAGIAQTVESKTRLKPSGQNDNLHPSPQVVNRIVNAKGFQSRSKRLRKAFWTTFAALFALLISAGVIATVLIVKANQKVRNALDDQTTAEKARDEANTARIDAEGKTKRAQTDLLAAQRELNKASEKLVTANEKTLKEQAKAEKAAREADKQQAIAKVAKLEADKQQKIAGATELANLVEVSREERPDLLEQNVQQAAKSLTEFVTLKTASVNADHALRTTVSLLQPTAARIPSSIGDHFTRPRDVAITPDGKFIALAGQNVRLCTITSVPNCSTRIPVYDVDKLAFSSDQHRMTSLNTKDGKYIATVWEKWDTENPIVIKTMVYEMGGTPSSFSPNGNYFVFVQGNDAKVSVNLLEIISERRVPLNYELPLGLKTKEVTINDVAISGEGRFLALGLIVDNGDVLVQVWDLRLQQLIRELPIISKKQYEQDKRMRFVSDIALSNDGNYLAIGFSEVGVGENGVLVFDVKNFRIVTQIQLKTDHSNTIRFSPDGIYLATNSSSGTPRMWNIEGGLEVARFTQSELAGTNENEVGNIAFSWEGEYFATISDSLSSKFVAQVWDIRKIKIDAPIIPKGFGIKTLLSTSGKYFAAIGMHHMDLWDIATHRVLPPLFQPSFPPDGIIFSPNDQYLAVENGKWYMWDIAKGEELLVPGHGSEINFSLNSELFATYGVNSDLNVCRPGSKKVFAKIPKNHQIGMAALSPNGNFIGVAAVRSNVVNILAINESEDLMLDQETASKISLNDSISRMMWSPDERYLAIVDQSGSIKLFNRIKGIIVVPSPKNIPIKDLEFSPNSQYFVVAREDRNLLIYKLSNPSQPWALPLANVPTILAFNSDGKHIAVGMDSYTVEVWNVATRQKVSHILFGSRLNSITFTPDGQYLVASIGIRGQARMLLWRPQDLIGEAYRRLSHTLQPTSN